MTTQQVDASQVPYQILNAEGKLVGPLPDLSNERLLALYRYMQLGRAFSNKVIALQRQGRATTFGSLVGQEATAIGLAAPLQTQDWLATSYREIASLIVKGVPLATMLYSFRGMTPANWPVESRCLPYQIVIGTQMLHAVGLGMAAKIAGDSTVAVGVCGDGATSEGDFNEALNFAGVFQAPVVLIVQNNGWAISVPRKKQSAAASFAQRGVGFGVPARLVDGNDILAVYDAVSQAVESARSGQGPSLIETLTYRIGAHTTADDPTRYRDAAEIASWQARDPIARFQTFLLERELLSQNKIEEMLAGIENEINQAVETAENTPDMAPDSFFDYAMADLTPRLQEQRADVLRHARQKE
ncbi:MAG TPA: pyruvate dehydrogenase (acetyl-transferring) E1 component subunit alpha [Ktedonobacteraceae bacterium]